MTQVFLVNLPWRRNGRFGVRAGSRWPFTSKPEQDGHIHYLPFPFFMAYATALLKANGINTKLIDAIALGTDMPGVLGQMGSCSPKLAVIETSTPSFMEDMQLVSAMRRQFPDTEIALCGPHASVFAGRILKEHQFLDYVLIGEYEYTLLELAQETENKKNFESVLGLAYRVGERVIINSNRNSINNLDLLPWPERDDVPIFKYNDGFAGLPQPNVQIWSSRGCPYQCSFCLWPQTMYHERKYRKRSAINVIDEVEYLIKRFGFKAVYFDDDIFNFDREHALGICEEMRRRKVSIPWGAMARADCMDQDMLKQMRDSGLYAIKYGIESADQEILRLCKKNMDLGKATLMIKVTKEMGIKVHLAFCLGLPGETKETIRKNYEFIKDTLPETAQFSFATPFPGTEYFDYAKNNGCLVSEKWHDYDGNRTCVVKTKGLESQDIEREMSVFANNFNV